MNKKLKGQRGYSLVELGISLSIVGVISVTAVTGIQSLLRQNRINKTLSQTQMAVAQIVSVGARENTTTRFSTVLFNKLGVWPIEFTSGTAAAPIITSPIGAAITTTPISASPGGSYGEKSAYFYTLTGVDTESCSELTQGLSDLAYSIYVRTSTAVTEATALPGNFKKKGVVSLDELSTACALTAPLAIDLIIIKG